MKIATAAVICCLGSFALAGCGTTSRTDQLTILGGVTGGTIGAVAGGSLGSTLVGGAAGAATGYVVARNTYPCWRTSIFGKRYKGWCIGKG